MLRACDVVPQVVECVSAICGQDGTGQLSTARPPWLHNLLIRDLNPPQGNPPLEANSFNFMGKFMKNQVKCLKRTPLSMFVDLNPPSRIPGSAPQDLG